MGHPQNFVFIYFTFIVVLSIYYNQQMNKSIVYKRHITIIVLNVTSVHSLKYFITYNLCVHFAEEKFLFEHFFVSEKKEMISVERNLQFGQRYVMHVARVRIESNFIVNNRVRIVFCIKFSIKMFVVFKFKLNFVETTTVLGKVLQEAVMLSKSLIVVAATFLLTCLLKSTLFSYPITVIIY